jgi:anti-sigma B factor antagonist
MVQIDTIKENDVTILNINGDVDASSSIQLDESLGAIVSNGDPKILIDCGGLNYISSAGLGVFMSYIEDVNSKNIKMALFGLNDKVMNVFEILGLDQLLTIVKTKKEAQSRINEV